MKQIILFLSLISLLFAEPKWVHKSEEAQGKKSAVGIAEFYFPSHVQQKVALSRARAKLFPSAVLQGQENNTIKSGLQKDKKVKIKDTYKDKEGNLYLLVIAL